MSDLTLDEKTNYAAMLAREEEDEKHFFDLNAGKEKLGFSVIYRNPGHWDVIAAERPGRASAWRHAHPTGFTSAEDGQRVRAFRIREEPGDVWVADERWNPHAPRPRPNLRFRSVIGAMLWIAEELMTKADHLAPVPAGEG